MITIDIWLDLIDKRVMPTQLQNNQLEEIILHSTNSAKREEIKRECLDELLTRTFIEGQNNILESQTI